MTAAAAHSEPFDWGVTEERVLAALDRLIAAADPVSIVAFGSRARGTAREDSDLDLAVILPGNSPRPEVPLRRALSGLNFSVDLITTNEITHNRFRSSINSVHHDIEAEGVVLYQKGAHGSPDRAAVAKICSGRGDAAA